MVQIIDGLFSAGGEVNQVQLLKLSGKLFELDVMSCCLERMSFQYDHYDCKSTWITIVFAALRLYAETFRIKAKSDLITSLKLDFKTHKLCADYSYVMGRVCFEEANVAEAKSHFTSSLSLSKNSEQINNALFGLAISEFYQKNYQACFSLLNSMKESSSVDAEHAIARRIWHAQVGFALGLADESLAVIREVKIKCQDERNIYFLIKALFVEIEILQSKGQYVFADKLLQDAQLLLPVNRDCATSRQLKKIKDMNIKAFDKPGFQLMESESKTILKTPDEKMVDLTKQEQIVLLLKRFVEKLESGLTKEEICKLLWNQDYHPLHMDNKIYVTIKRLRTYLGDTGRENRYLIQKNSKYILNNDFGFTLFQHKFFENKKINEYQSQYQTEGDKNENNNHYTNISRELGGSSAELT